MTAQIRLLSAGDEALLGAIAPEVFDDPIVAATLKRYLTAPNHHLFVAREHETIVGFLSAVLYEHPDKTAPELWINELGVSPAHQRQGLGAALLDTALAHARTLGCSEGWVLTDRNNDKAKRLYASRTKENPIEVQMFTFLLAPPPPAD